MQSVRHDHAVEVLAGGGAEAFDVVQLLHAAACDHRGVDGAAQGGGGRRVILGSATHGAIDDGCDTFALEVLRRLGGIRMGELGPATFGTDLAVPHVHGHHDVAGIFEAEVVDEMRGGERSHAEHHEVRAGFNIGEHRLLTLHAARHLHRHAGAGGHDALHHGGMHG